MIFAEKIKYIYKSRMFSGCNDTGLVKYFTHKDFEGLCDLDDTQYPEKITDYNFSYVDIYTAYGNSIDPADEWLATHPEG